jgi:hypothetical protein
MLGEIHFSTAYPEIQLLYYIHSGLLNLVPTRYSSTAAVDLQERSVTLTGFWFSGQKQIEKIYRYQI